MGNILDIAGSYVIGGIVLIALTVLLLSFGSEAQEVKLTEITQRSLYDVGSIIEYDFNKLGYRVESGDKITSFASDGITFLADLDNNGTAETITYSLIESDNKKYLKRIAGTGSNNEWTYPVKGITLTGYDSTGTSTVNTNKIKSVAFEIELETDSFNSSYKVQGAAWKKQFYPKNL